MRSPLTDGPENIALAHKKKDRLAAVLYELKAGTFLAPDQHKQRFMPAAPEPTDCLLCP